MDEQETAKRCLSSPRLAQSRQERRSASSDPQLIGIGLAAELLDDVRGEVRRYGLGARAWMASPGYLRLCGRYLKRARHAGAEAERTFIQLLGAGGAR